MLRLASRLEMHDSGQLHVRDESAFGLYQRDIVQRLLATTVSFSHRNVVGKDKGKLCARLGKAKVRYGHKLN